MDGAAIGEADTPRLSRLCYAYGVTETFCKCGNGKKPSIIGNQQLSKDSLSAQKKLAVIMLTAACFLFCLLLRISYPQMLNTGLFYICIQDHVLEHI